MKISSVEFLLSAKDTQQLPQKKYPEYAFAGRSNVGKSSLINCLLNRKDFAKISDTPGKTKSLNAFLVNESWTLMDLPGYGYAKVSKTERQHWKNMLENYFQLRQQLWCVFALIDLRHELQNSDKNFLILLLEQEIPFSLIFTKSDKLSKQMRAIQCKKLCESIHTFCDPLPSFFLTSSKTKEGKNDILSYIEVLNQKFRD